MTTIVILVAAVALSPLALGLISGTVQLGRRIRQAGRR